MKPSDIRETFLNELKSHANDASKDIANVYSEVMQRIKVVNATTALEQLRVEFLGKSGKLQEFRKRLGKLEASERSTFGKVINEAISHVDAALAEKKEILAQKELEQRLEDEAVDVTERVFVQKRGHYHPITQVIREIRSIFVEAGFEIVEGPEVETDYYNFESLNIPKTHPARDMQDTFYITEELLLRTHTSNAQTRTLHARPNETFRIISPGKVFRRDTDDPTHSHQFTQIEGMAISRVDSGKNITMANLFAVLELVAKRIFGETLDVRFRPSYFPFTEPSVEVDVECSHCKGKGCRVCKHTGWIEILGAGMCHPRLLEMAGYNPEEYTGFAFGMGPDRIAMLKYGISDIRAMYTNDVRFLEQF